MLPPLVKKWLSRDPSRRPAPPSRSPRAPRSAAATVGRCASLPRRARCGIGWAMPLSRRRDGEGSARVVPAASHTPRRVRVCRGVARERARMSIQGDSPCRRRGIKQRAWCTTQGLMVRAADVEVTETMGPKSRVTLNVPTHPSPRKRKGVGALATGAYGVGQGRPVRIRTRRGRVDPRSNRMIRRGKPQTRGACLSPNWKRRGLCAER